MPRSSTTEPHGIILHEFGHALGILHEHQSPVANCVNEYNWEFIVKYLSGPPNNWDERKPSSSTWRPSAAKTC